MEHLSALFALEIERRRVIYQASLGGGWGEWGGVCGHSGVGPKLKKDMTESWFFAVQGGRKEAALQGRVSDAFAIPLCLMLFVSSPARGCRGRQMAHRPSLAYRKYVY